MCNQAEDFRVSIGGRFSFWGGVGAFFIDDKMLQLY